MITDHITNFNRYIQLNPGFNEFMVFFKKTDFSTLKTGVTIINENLYYIFSNYETKEQNSLNWETHQKYIDIQFIFKGEEYIGYTMLENLSPVQDYNNENDYQLFKGDGDLFLLKENHFAVFFPNEPHKPGVQLLKSEKISKIVFKVKYD